MAKTKDQNVVLLEDLQFLNNSANKGCHVIWKHDTAWKRQVVAARTAVLSSRLNQPKSSKLVSSKKTCFTPRTSGGHQTRVHQTKTPDSYAGSGPETSSDASSTECDDSEEKLEKLQR